MALSGMTGARRWTGRLLLLAQALLAVLISGALIWLSMKPSLKRLYDVTETERYSVDPSTKELLEQIRAEHAKDSKRLLEISTVYVPIPSLDDPRMTQEMRHGWGITQRVQELTTDLLRQYAYLGGDAVKVAHYDQVRDIAKTRDFVKTVGLQVENALVVRLGGRTKALGLDMDLADVEMPDPKVTAVPGSVRVATLRAYKGEEAISSAIKSLLLEGKPKVYIATGYAEPPIDKPSADSYSELANRLHSDDFEIVQYAFEKAAQIPDDAAIVAFLEPRREPSQRVQQLLLDYLQRGGRVVINASFIEHPVDWNPTFEWLGEQLGFALGTDLVCAGIVDPTRPSNQFVSQVPQVRTLTISELSPTLEPTRPLRRIFGSVIVNDAREIVAREPRLSGTKVDPSLLLTSPNAWLEPRAPDDSVPRAPLAPAQRDRFGVRSVGAVVEVPNAKSAERPGRLVLVGGTAFVNYFMAKNSDLGMNVFHWLAERKQLVSVRGARYTSRSLSHVTPQQLGRSFRLLVFWVPGGLMALALFVLWRRSRA